MINLEFESLRNQQIDDVFLELTIQKMMLPDKLYLDLAFNVLYQIDIDATDEEIAFIKLVMLYNFSKKPQLSVYIKKMQIEKIREPWQRDFSIWQSVYQKLSIDYALIEDRYLKSWLLVYEGLRYVEEKNYEMAAQACEQSLLYHSRNVNALICLFSIHLLQDNPDSSYAKAKTILLERIPVFADSAIITLYLQSFLAKHIYRPHYPESPWVKDRIESFGFYLDEPSIKSGIAPFIRIIIAKEKEESVWYYFRAFPNRVKFFEQYSTTEVTDLHQLGVVLYSAYGEEPPRVITDRIMREYGLTDSSNLPIVLKNLLKVTRQAEMTAHHAQALQRSESLTATSCIEIRVEDLVFQELLGVGSFANVNKGLWNGAINVAIKSYHSSESPTERVAEAQHELQIMRFLSSPYLVKLYGYNLSDHSPLLIMEYGENRSLYDFLHGPQAMILWSLRIKIAHNIISAVSYLHEHGYIHGDIKSFNVILFKDYQAKITDFSLTCREEEAQPTTSGTILWFSPEVVRGEKKTKSSDIWSYGMTLFEITSRQLPFHDAQTETQAREWIVSGEGESPPHECEMRYPKVAQLLRSCFEEPKQRPAASQIIELPIFNSSTSFC
ncbi:MAG: protein kinase [Saprospiraceae bacterium]|nr:protein kinase [Saprospiraceae bacterium]